jgi:acetoin utilization protein AcuC
VNSPFSPHADDLIFEQALRRMVMPLLTAYRPDVLVTQMGVDALRSDPLSRLEWTTGALELAARLFRDTGVPWIVLGGGGYDKMNVARGWALIWAAVLDVPAPDLLPEGFVQIAAQLGYQGRRLRDLSRLAQPDDFARAQQQLERHLVFLERKLFPLHGLLPGGGR